MNNLTPFLFSCSKKRIISEQTFSHDNRPTIPRQLCIVHMVRYSLNYVSKNRGSFHSDEALLKLFYLARNNIGKKWTMPIRDWKAALNRFTIQFEDRMPQQ